jgi:hypothetical protein
MGDPSALQLEELFFPMQDVRANPEHNQQGERAGTRLHVAHQLAPIDGKPGKYALSVSVRSDNENSKNAPYAFAIEGYAVISTPETRKIATEHAAVLLAGLPVVKGAIRERIAELTSRAPWGRFLLNFDEVTRALPEAKKSRISGT